MPEPQQYHPKPLPVHAMRVALGGPLSEPEARRWSLHHNAQVAAWLAEDVLDVDHGVNFVSFEDHKGNEVTADGGEYIVWGPIGAPRVLTAQEFTHTYETTKEA